MKPILLLLRLPLSHIDSDWLPVVEPENWNEPDNQEWAADHILSASGSLSPLCWNVVPC
jgi:hypothetical protein